MSVYATALNGLQTQSRAAATYAQRIAESGAEGHRALNRQEDAPSGSALPEDIVSFSEDALADSLIGMDMAKHLFAANTKVIAAQRDMDDHLLDILS